MKNMKSNVGSFATAKLQATMVKMLSIFTIVAVIGFSMACGGDDGGNNVSPVDEPIPGNEPIPPEDKPVQDRWGKWIDEDSTATLDYSVDDDGVCTITVGGTAMPHNETDGWYRWKANASYEYTAKAGVNYVYTFEAWTESGTRELSFQYNTDSDEEIYLYQIISITSTRTTYTVYGEALSNGALNHVEFQCANQLGTFYVKIIDIKPITIGKLTITNFADILEQNNYIDGDLDVSTVKDTYIRFGAKNSYSFTQIKGSTLALSAWEWKYDEENDKFIVTPYTGNITAAIGELVITHFKSEEYDGLLFYPSVGNYRNKVPITFTNGNATIDFGTQMEIFDDR